MRRAIDQRFVSDLKGGVLKGFLDGVKDDDALCLEIRSGYINIYYRGGNLFKISPAPRKGGYKVFFDPKYAAGDKSLQATIKGIEPHNPEAWIENTPLLKSVMDSYFSKHPKSEREFQQLIERENNYSVIAKSTDYYIGDIEYANSANSSRFDMLAVKWIRRDSKNRQKATLSFIEVKYGDNALKGDAGICKHVADIVGFLKSGNNKAEIIEEVNGLYEQKNALGLMSGAPEDVSILPNSALEFVLLVSNHTPASSLLDDELEKVMASVAYAEMKELGCQMKIAVASLMGYGLYDECMIPLEDYLVR
ncbi:MAG: hypothetical protein LBC35_00025 [Coriobacteriales bacterium]|jgi:hypothetical protein|nr:hypothetical protein [Coriobacteriales bacterium]